jgi:predicted NBD/HSP70 family sugar kinase
MVKNTTKIVTGNQGLVKNINSNIVLNLVRTSAPISGAELSKLTGMRPATIQNILKNLEKDGLVENIGTGTSTKMGGRRPTLWNICDNYGYIIGIQLEINEVQAVLVNLKSEIIDEYHSSSKMFDTLVDIERTIVAVINRMLERNNIDQDKLLGVGIGVSGIVNISSGAIIKTSLLGTSEQPIYFEKALRKYVNVPIYIENDANAAAHAEKWFGKARGWENIIFALSVVNKDVFGIGFGLLIKNELYRGANMFAGETYPFDLNIQKILKNYCHYSESTISLNNKEIEVQDIELHHLVDAVDEKNDVVQAFFENVGRLIAKEIISVINLLDPNMIVLGGEISKAEDYILEPIRHAMNSHCPLIEKRKLQLVGSALEGNSVPLGAASIILQKIFHEPKFKSYKASVL